MFRNLNVKISKGIMAPHKAILLISIMELINGKRIPSNKIYLENELAITFKNNWEIFVKDNSVFNHYKCSPWTPFWHMKTEPFWHFKYYNGQIVEDGCIVDKGKTASIGQMRAYIEYAYLDTQLFELVQNPSSYHELRKVLLNTFICGNNSISKENAKIKEIVLLVKESQYETIINKLHEIDGITSIGSRDRFLIH